MYPILFAADATSFSNLGIGVLSSAIECTVTEERNGIYELFMRYPDTGVHFDEIVNSAIIVVTPSEGADKQPYRIYKVTRPINGIISVYAQHISYQLSYIPTLPFTAYSASSALAGLKNNAAENCPFTFSTDIDSNATYVQDEPESIRSRLGGQDGSILDIYGGEFEWDVYAVKLWSARGTNRDVTLRYGKNIMDISQEESIEETYTGILPYWKDDEQTIILPEGVIHSSASGNYPFQRTIPVDFSSDFEDAPTETQLRNAAVEYINRNNIGIPAVSIKVSFVALWQTAEYASVAPLERVKLCDTLQVYFEKLGINTTAEVVTTVYDCLLERYTSIELGEPRVTLSDTIADTATTIVSTAKELTAETKKAVNTATKYITGQKGGYVVLHLDGETKKPYEILIMDTDNIETAEKVWRWNNSGWGYSKTGYDGSYDLAATIDGVINADFIQAGTMKADRIFGGTLTLGGDQDVNGRLEVKDGSGMLRGSWSNEGIRSLWVEPNSNKPTDHLSINSEAAGVIFIQEVTQNSTVDNPIPSGDTNLWISCNGIEFNDGSEYQGYLYCDSLVVWDNENYCSEFSADRCYIDGDLQVDGDFEVTGQKNRAVPTDFGRVALTAYETASPYFGDIGSGVIGEDGFCYVDLDARLADVANVGEYHVFLTPYGEASLTVERYGDYFVVAGNPGDSFSWEVKAKQKGYEADRFEVKAPFERRDRHKEKDEAEKAAEYIAEMEAESLKTDESEGE